MAGTGRMIAIVLLAAAGGACASVERPTLAGRFIRQGTPAMDLGGVRPASMRSIDRHALLRATPSPRVSAAPTASLEASDPAVRDALARVTLAPTTEHYLEAADAYVKQGVRDRAHDYLTRSLSNNGPDARVYDALARRWRDWGQPGEGLGHAHRAVYLAPQSAVAHNTLGTVLYRLGQVADAEVSFTQALAADPKAWYAMANLCHVSMNTGRTRAAIAQCRRAAALRKAARASE
jgi:tetratricopeptide (TPR) repeat protein